MSRLFKFRILFNWSKSSHYELGSKDLTSKKRLLKSNVEWQSVSPLHSVSAKRSVCSILQIELSIKPKFLSSGINKIW